MLPSEAGGLTTSEPGADELPAVPVNVETTDNLLLLQPPNNDSTLTTPAMLNTDTEADVGEAAQPPHAADSAQSHATDVITTSSQQSAAHPGDYTQTPAPPRENNTTGANSPNLSLSASNKSLEKQPTTTKPYYKSQGENNISSKSKVSRNFKNIEDIFVESPIIKVDIIPSDNSTKKLGRAAATEAVEYLSPPENILTNITIKLVLSLLKSKLVSYEVLSEDVAPPPPRSAPLLQQEAAQTKTTSPDPDPLLALVLVVASLLAILTLCLVILLACKLHQASQTNTYWIN